MATRSRSASRAAAAGETRRRVALEAVGLAPEERRRTRDDSGKVPCKVCFARIKLSLDRIDDTPTYVYHRCPACEQWSTIRREDLDRLRAEEG